MIPGLVVRKILAVLLALGFLTGSALAAAAQNSELYLAVSKDFGYSSGDQLRGTFTLQARGPENLAAATFKIDGQVVGEVTAPPFKIQIKTGEYSSGYHDLLVEGRLSDGGTLVSPARHLNFITAEQEGTAMRRIIFPILGLVVVGMLVSFAAQMFLARGKSQPVAPGTARRYGISGGAICPKCQRPTPLHLTGLNLSPVAKFDRCENCGRWSLMRHRSRAELEAAETAESQLEQASLTVSESPEEELRKKLDESRYIE